MHRCGKLSRRGAALSERWVELGLENDAILGSGVVGSMTPSMQTRTIYSVSSGQGRAGVAVIRISGPHADAALEALCGKLPPYRQACLVTLRAPTSLDVLDRCLALRFAEGASFTGEASVELQVHGGLAVVKAVLHALSGLDGLKVAEAGEFTRRALENGRMDLTQVEALGDLIAADTDAQRRLALHGFEGAFGRSVREWREWLLEARALVAAEIDFSDEGDVGDAATSEIDSVLQRLERGFTAALAQADHGRIVTEGMRVAILGAPNVGKSTLLNAFAGSDVAIVTEHAGTTRDIVEVRLDLSGYAVVLQDTAGLREANDPVERIGIDRALQAARAADLLLLLDDGSNGFPSCPEFGETPSIRVRSKWDRSDERIEHSQAYDIAVSGVTGHGLDSLQKRILSHLEKQHGDERPLITRERQRLAVVAALDACRAARRARLVGIDFLDEELRRIDEALAGVLGLIGVEEVLGAIFSKFCVGK